MKNRQKIISACGNVLFFAAFLICAYLQAILTGFTNLTDEAKAVLYPSAGDIRMVFRVLLWVLSAGELLINWKRAIVCILFCLAYSFDGIPGQNMYLIELVLLAGLSNYATKKNILHVWLGMHIAYLIILLLLYHFGWAKDAPMMNYKTIIPVAAGHSYGMGHSNGLGALIMTTAMGLWLLVRPRKWWISFVYFEVIGLITLGITISRTSSYVLFFFPFLVLFFQSFRRANEKGRKILKLFSAGVPILALAAVFCLGAYVILIRKAGSGSTASFWMRFTDLRAIRNYPPVMLGPAPGVFSGDYYFDNLFIRLIEYCGVIPFVIATILSMMMQYHLAETKQTDLLTASTSFFIYGLLEHVIMYTFFNFVPCVAYAAEDTDETDRRIAASLDHISRLAGLRKKERNNNAL